MKGKPAKAYSASKRNGSVQYGTTPKSDILTPSLISTESILRNGFGDDDDENGKHKHHPDEDIDYENEQEMEQAFRNSKPPKGKPYTDSNNRSRGSLTTNNDIISGSMEYGGIAINRRFSNNSTSNPTNRRLSNPSRRLSNPNTNRRQSNPSRRPSITGDDTSSDHHRHTISTGIADERRISLVGNSQTRYNPDNIHSQTNQTRRKSSLANAQERAAAFALMNA